MQDDPKRVQEGEMAGMAAPNDASGPMPLGFYTLANRYRSCREEVSYARASPPSKPMEFHGLRELMGEVYGIRLVNCILLATQSLAIRSSLSIFPRQQSFGAGLSKTNRH